MIDLEQNIIKHNQFIHEEAKKLILAQNKTVSLDGLENKMEMKYMNYFERKIQQKLKVKSDSGNTSVVSIAHQ